MFNFQLSRFPLEICFITSLFLPGFLIGLGVYSPWTHISVLTFVVIVYLLVTKNIPPMTAGLITCPIILLQLPNFVSYFEYGFGFEYSAVRIVLDTHVQEAAEFAQALNGWLFLAILLLAIFYFCVLFWYMKSPLRVAGWRNRISAVVLGAICALILDYFHKPNFDIYSYIHAYRLMFKYSSWHQEVEQASEHRAKKFKLAEQSLTAHKNHEKFDDIVIVVVGELVRRKNMQLYGYSRPTTPFLNQRKNELLIFEKAISPATSTVLSLKHALTPLRPGDKEMLIDQPSLVSEARLAGFKTSWITNTYLLGRHASPITIMARDAHELRSTSLETRNEKFRRYDGVVLPLVDELLTKQGKEKKFIFIGTMGSHAIFRYRYPPEFTKFKPVIENDANYHPDLAAEIINAYDNSILYTDWLLDELITRLEKSGKPSTLIYFSDHGKRLYDDGKTIKHGFAKPMKVEVEVPLIVWQSKNSRCKADALRGHTGQLFNLSDLYHLAKFATCIDMKTPDIEFDPRVWIHNKVMNYHQFPKG